MTRAAAAYKRRLRLLISGSMAAQRNSVIMATAKWRNGGSIGNRINNGVAAASMKAKAAKPSMAAWRKNQRHRNGARKKRQYRGV